MTTNLKLTLTDDELKALGLKLTGKNVPATRKQITAWAMKALADALAGRNGGRTEMRNMVCPKCSKPIAVQCPVIQAPAEAPQPTLYTPSTPVPAAGKYMDVKVSPELQAWQGTPELAAAVKKAAEALQDMAIQMARTEGVAR